jgi:hypothetical protein
LLFSQLWRVPACLALAASFLSAQTYVNLGLSSESAAAQQVPLPDMPTSWFDRLWQIWSAPQPLDLALVAPIAPAGPPCLSAPLPAIDDTEALAFEAGVGSSAVVNLDGLVPAASRALSRFETYIGSAGGRMVLTSAYRPAAYQTHLQAVWDKWVLELKHNYAPECGGLRAEVEEEFTRHQLLETQRPVQFSDHTRGIGIDAAIVLPRNATLGRKRVGIDTLARIAGFRRPAIAQDPVHFRYIARL